MSIKRLAWAALLAGTIATSGTVGANTNGTGARQIFMVRIFTSEVPSAVLEEGRYVRIGVILPPLSKVVKIEAFMDEQNYGRSIDRWRKCDFRSGSCDVGGSRVEGLSRRNSDTDVQIMANFWNMHESRSRFAKLKVTFLPIGNPKKTYRPKECWLRTECGYAGWMDAAYEEEEPFVGGR